LQSEGMHDSEFEETGEAVDAPASGRAYPPSVQAGIPNLGVLPEGWKRYRLGELVTPVERPAALREGHIYQLVTAKRNRGGIVAREKLTADQIRTKTQFLVKAGDFLLSNRQISHGGCGVLPEQLDGALVSNEYTALRATALLDPGFLTALSHSVYFQQTCFHSSVGIHVEKLVFRLNDWLSWPFNIPPLEEQRRIADVLETWDRAIVDTERLISKNRIRKSALLQLAFQNLPMRPLGEAAKIWFSGVDKKIDPKERSVILCNYMDVFHNARITRDLPFTRGTATAREIAQNALKRNDVVFTKDSETADEIAEPALVADDIENLVCGYHLAVARPIEGRAHGPFIAQAMRHPRTRWQFRRIANGVVRFGLTLDAVEQAEIFLPDVEVQVRVAATLESEDRLIEALSGQAVSLRVQRRELMQRLLSGQWRLRREAV